MTYNQNFLKKTANLCETFENPSVIYLGLFIIYI